MGGCGIEVVKIFFDVFAVVAFRAGEAEEPFLQNRIVRVPKCQGKTEPALAVGDTEQAIFAPAISAASGVIVGEIIPDVAVG